MSTTRGTATWGSGASWTRPSPEGQRARGRQPGSRPEAASARWNEGRSSGEVPARRLAAVRGGPVIELADRRIPAADVFRPEVEDVCRAVLRHTDIGAMVKLAEEFLLEGLPAPDAAAEEVAGMVESITADPALFRVDQAAEALRVSVRTLQRLFAEYVGASPKWVLRRARLHEAAARADQGLPIDWAALAQDLGYFDQSHLTRDFTAAVGVSPARYAGLGT